MTEIEAQTAPPELGYQEQSVISRQIVFEVFFRDGQVLLSGFKLPKPDQIHKIIPSSPDWSPALQAYLAGLRRGSVREVKVWFLNNHLLANFVYPETPTFLQRVLRLVRRKKTIQEPSDV